MQAPSGAEGEHLVLYDGVCGLCSRLLAFLLVHDRRRRFAFASLQSERGRSWVLQSGRNPDDLTSFYVVTDYRQPSAALLAKSRAALFVAQAIGWPWKALTLFGALPTSWLDRVYDLIARHRYRVFGRYDRCLVPRPEDRSRFVE